MSQLQQLKELIKSKNHVIWDWNGTLLDDIQHAVNTINEILVDHKLKPTDIPQYREIFGFPIRDYYTKLGLAPDDKSFEAISYRFVDTYMSTVMNCKLFNHTLPLLEVAKSNNKLQSILSASDQESLNYVVEKYQIQPYFDHVIGIEDKFASSKLHKGHELIKKSQVSPTETLLIGDTEHDLEVGHALGVEVVLIAHGHHSYERLTKKHHQVFVLQ